MAGISFAPDNDSNVLLRSVVNSATGGTIAAPAGTSGFFIRVYKLFLQVGGSTNITFEDGSTALSGTFPMATNGQMILTMDGSPWYSCSLGNAFNIVASGSVQVSGVVYYTSTQFGN